MDPLSAAASIVGLLGAAATITTILKAIVATVKHTPQLVANLLIEVSDIASCLGQLQAFLSGAVAISRTRKSLLMVDQIAVTLTNCVLIFSELEETIEKLKLNLPILPATIRLRFTSKEAAITKLLTRLHASKLSLTLMLTTLTCSTIEEAQASIESLNMLVNQVLESNEEMSQRLASIRIQSDTASSGSTAITCGRGYNDDDASTIRPCRPDDGNLLDSELRQTTAFGFAFEQDLQRSRVYRRALIRDAESSVSSSLGRSVGWSLLSGLSLADISCLSVISLPVSGQEIWKSSYYEPGDGHIGHPLYSSSSSKVEDPLLELSGAVASEKVAVKSRLSISTSYSLNELGNALAVCERCNKVIGNGVLIKLSTGYWHAGCYRCTSCGNLCGTDSTVFLLPDGAFNCHNCSIYHSSVCENVIKALAIVTDCEPCFRCHKCQEVIRNLKHRRTSLGILCMECHKAMERRRLKGPREQGILWQKMSLAQAVEKKLPQRPTDGDGRVLQFNKHVSTGNLLNSAHLDVDQSVKDIQGSIGIAL